jgi:hypothetical protein
MIEENHKNKLRIVDIITPCDLVRCNKYDYTTDIGHHTLKHPKAGMNCLSATRTISTESTLILKTLRHQFI